MMKVTQRIGVDQDFVAALAKAKRYARGQKPVRALREIGLEANVQTETPTSEGVAAMLAQENLKGHRVGLQLYPDKDHGKLIAAITSYGATVEPVLPYIYDGQAADTNIVAAIGEMAQRRVDAIALTSSGQVRRLIDVARAHNCEDQLRAGLKQTPVASVGPVVSDELKANGLHTDIYPANDSFFMKPLISAMAAALNKTPPRMARQV